MLVIATEFNFMMTDEVFWLQLRLMAKEDTVDKIEMEYRKQLEVAKRLIRMSFQLLRCDENKCITRAMPRRS